ncbi:MAG: glycosyltransferase family 39 protein [Elusimicrobiota bacterium]
MSKKFWVVFILALVVRLWGITNPLLDEHSWRQTASAMVARNYMESLNLFTPSVDFEYPYPNAFGLYEFAVGVIAKITGFSDLLGRMVSLLVFLSGFIFFYKLVKHVWDEDSALWASIFYAILPVSVIYSRAFQTDGSMVSMTIIFLYHFVYWVNNKKSGYYILAVLFAGIAFMLKIPAIFILLPALWYWCVKDGLWVILRDTRLYILLLLSLALPVFYHYYVPIATDGKILNAFTEQDKWGSINTWLNPRFWIKTFSPFGNLFEYQYMHAGYILLILGLFKKSERSTQYLAHIWFLSTCILFIAMAEGMHHEYYYLPMMPAACVLIGRFVTGVLAKSEEREWKAGKTAMIWGKGLVWFLVVYTCIFSTVRLYDRLKLSNYRYLVLARIASDNTVPGDKIVAVTKSEPEILYYSNRKGIHIRSLTEALWFIQTLKDENKGKYKIVVISDYEVKTQSPELYRYLTSHGIIAESAEGIVAKL